MAPAIPVWSSDSTAEPWRMLRPSHRMSSSATASSGPSAPSGVEHLHVVRVGVRAPPPAPIAEPSDSAGRGLVVDGSVPTMVSGPLSPVLVLWAGRSFVGENALVSCLSSHRPLGAFSRPICFPRRPRALTGGPGPPPSSTCPWEAPAGPSRRPYRPRTRRSSIGPQSSSDRHWRRSSDMEPRRRPSELAEHPRLHG